MAKRYVGPVEQDVPLPSSRNYAGLRAPMEKLRPALKGGEPRDSFTTDATRNGCYSMARKLGIKINVRPEGNRVRVWRVDEASPE